MNCSYQKEFIEKWLKLKTLFDEILLNDNCNFSYQEMYNICYRLSIVPKLRSQFIVALTNYNLKTTHLLNKKKVDTINSVLIYLRRKHNFNFKLYEDGHVINDQVTYDQITDNILDDQVIENISKQKEITI